MASGRAVMAFEEARIGSKAQKSLRGTWEDETITDKTPKWPLQKKHIQEESLGVVRESQRQTRALTRL